MTEDTDLRCFCDICGGRVAFPPHTEGTMSACPHCSAQILLKMSPEAMREDGIILPGDDAPIPTKSAFPKPLGRKYVPPAPDDLVACRECGTVAVQAQMQRDGDQWICFECQPPAKPEPVSELQVDVEYAPFWTRAGAKAIDAVILAFVAALVALLFGGLTASVGAILAKLPFLPSSGFFAKALAAIVTSLPLIVFYNVWFLVKRGATPGKFVCDLKVINSNGDPVGWGQATLRILSEIFLACTVNILFFQANYVIAAVDRQHRTFHDTLAKTWVVVDKDARKRRTW